jgi:hypothetical protein
MDIDKIIKAIPKITEIWFRTLEYLIVVGILGTVAYKLDNDWQAWTLTIISFLLMLSNLFLANMDRATDALREENRNKEFTIGLWIISTLKQWAVFVLLYLSCSVLWTLGGKIITKHLF